MVIRPMFKRVCVLLTVLLLVIGLFTPLILVATSVYAEQSVNDSSYDGGVYYVPITITEESGVGLQDYSVKIVLNNSNFAGWNHIASLNGSDIYFLDGGDNPLYYWIESFDINSKEAVIWVKVDVPALSSVTIYMYYGGSNSFRNYNDPEKVFLFFDGFDDNNLDTSKWTFSTSGNGIGSYNETSGYLEVSSGSQSGARVITNDVFYLPLAVEGRWVYVDGTEMWLALTNATDITGQQYNYHIRVGYSTYLGEFVYQVRVRGNHYFYDEISRSPPYSFARFSWVVTASKTVYYEEGLQVNQNTAQDVFTEEDPLHLYLSTWNGVARWDWIAVRKYVDPEPSISIGVEKIAHSVELPFSSMYLIHNIVYSPNSTQFTHTFSATNITTAGYEIGYVNEYGWRVYANPFDSTENNATLISEVNITLPYTEVLVENVTLLAKTNGIGSFRQLWIKMLDGSGSVVAELTNATMGTDWTEIVLDVNANLSGQITIWINATVGSTSAVGEEIAIRDVKVFVRHEANPVFKVYLVPNVDYFNCSTTFAVELGSSEYLNSSVITFKLVEYLIYNGTDYPVEPVYVGNETIDSLVYNVYKIDSATYSYNLTIFALLENKIKSLRTHVRGYDTETVLVGESLVIELPVVGNISIPDLGVSFINVSKATLRFTSVGTFSIVANLSKVMLWEIGYRMKLIKVKYGALTARFLDIDSREIDYEELELHLVNKTSGAIVKVVAGNRQLNVSGLWAGNYTLEAKLKGIIVCVKDFELNITTDNSIVDMTCTLKSLAKDYRGVSRTLAIGFDKQFLGIESLSTLFPYSRMRLLINGTGWFKAYINYRGDLPSKVSVKGNVTGLKYYWDGTYLVVEGSLGSIGELVVTDLYKIRIEMYDRLGNILPVEPIVFINSSSYTGPVAEDFFYPDYYLIELPINTDGFEFYSFFDGYNESARVVAINHTDITLKAWYRVPTSIEIKGYQVASLWWLPFIRQEGEKVKVYVEGYLKDFYGNGVPDKPLVVNITNVETGYTRSYNVTTDASGYFRTPLIELFREKTYRVKVIYNGDDVYVGTLSILEVKPEELPAAPALPAIPIEYIIVAIATILIVVAVATSLKAMRHNIESLRDKSRKFVRKKR